MQSLKPLLAEHPFFEGLAGEYVELLAECSANIVVEEGETIFRAGMPANHFYVIREGRVGLGFSAPGHGSMRFQTLGDGNIMGWSWLTEPYEYRYSAEALARTRMITLDATCLRKKCEADPKLGYELLKRFSCVMANRIEATRIQLLDLYAPTAGGSSS